jgi:hypothetical protein
LPATASSLRSLLAWGISRRISRPRKALARCTPAWLACSKLSPRHTTPESSALLVGRTDGWETHGANSQRAPRARDLPCRLVLGFLVTVGSTSAALHGSRWPLARDTHFTAVRSRGPAAAGARGDGGYRAGAPGAPPPLVRSRDHVGGPAASRCSVPGGEDFSRVIAADVPARWIYFGQVRWRSAIGFDRRTERNARLLVPDRTSLVGNVRVPSPTGYGA